LNVSFPLPCCSAAVAVFRGCSCSRRTRSVMPTMQAVPAYGDDLRPKRPGRPPRRSPVIKLAGSNNEQAVPGPGAYSPRRLSDIQASSWSLSSRNPPLHAQKTAETPGPVYTLKSSLLGQATSSRPNAAQYAFPKEQRAATMSPRTVGPGPAAYVPEVDKGGHSNNIMSKDCERASRVRPLNTRPLGLQLERAPTPGPTSYSPRNNAGTDGRNGTLDGPRYSMEKQSVREGMSFAVSPEYTPGPAAYKPTPMSVKGGGQFGDAPTYSLSNSNIPKRFISKSHEKANFGFHSPGPQAYTPREGLGITSYTISNTSTHAPQFSFGTEPRVCGEDAARMMMAAKTGYQSPRGSTPRGSTPRMSARAVPPSDPIAAPAKAGAAD